MSKQIIDIMDRVSLIVAKVDILKLKSDHYNWSCHVPDETKASLEATLVEIDSLLAKESK